MTSGDEAYEGFSVDNVLYSADEEAIHFNLYVPESHDGESAVPLYLIVGADDEYYGAGPTRDTAQRLRSLYASHGLSDSEIDSLVVLDVRDSDYFTNHGATNQHGDGANLFARDPAVMDWLFGR